MEMNANSEPLSTRENMSAAEYQEASWLAYELQNTPPDPALLSDHTLHAFLHFEGPDLLLPSTALQAVEAESLRRGPSPMFVDEVSALVMLGGLSVGGVVIGLGLLIP
jgi:hypothetical protein